jgi:2-polyprenyl-3-methyl-5-hydroxy-6-metoxy-1,4-benzoquinol methylase
MSTLPTNQAPSSWSGPLAQSATSLAESARALGASQWASTLRAWCVPYLFHGLEDVFKLPADPAIGLKALFDDLAAYLQASATSGFSRLTFPPSERATGLPVEKVTGEHYGRLFREFSKESFAGEPARLLGDRLSRNDVKLPDLASARVLDAGCGGGRYAVAWHLLGAREVLGVDLSEPGINDARARADQMKLEGVKFELHDVVELPLPPNSFDVVFSNGVLHHTRDWKRGVTNLLKVLKPGGLGWLYLIENPGGYFWDMIELCRDIMKDEVHEQARIAVSLLGVPANRIYYMLDHVMVPINLRLTPEEIRAELTAAGAKDIRRLTRGTDFDRVERIHQGDPFAVAKYGVGENRFVFTK